MVHVADLAPTPTNRLGPRPPFAAAATPVAAQAAPRGPMRPGALASTRRRIKGAHLERQCRRLDGLTLLVGAGISVCIPPREGAPAWLLGLPLCSALPLALGLLLARRLLQDAKLYTFPACEPWWSHASKAMACLGAAAGASLVSGLFLQSDQRFLARAWTGAGALALVGHLMAWLTVRRCRKSGLLTPNVVIVGANNAARRLIEAAMAAGDAAALAVFDDRKTRVPDDIHGVPVVGGIDDLLAHRTLPFVDRIIIAVAPSAESRVAALVGRLRYLPNSVTLFLTAPEGEAGSETLKRFSDASLSHLSGTRENDARTGAKRAQDLVLGAVFLSLALPLMALIALAIRLDGGGPVLFHQRRYGFNGEVIGVWKFRTLRTDMTDHLASQQITRHDPRATRIRRILRRLSLDELPQLVNVIRGEMSLVGPRPHAVGMKTYGEATARLVSCYAWRHRVKPGLTGWAQINGSIGPVDTPELVRRRVAFDADYVDRQSSWLDMRIRLLTGPALIAARNIVR